MDKTAHAVPVKVQVNILVGCWKDYYLCERRRTPHWTIPTPFFCCLGTKINIETFVSRVSWYHSLRSEGYFNDNSNFPTNRSRLRAMGCPVIYGKVEIGCFSIQKVDDSHQEFKARLTVYTIRILEKNNPKLWKYCCYQPIGSTCDQRKQ